MILGSQITFNLANINELAIIITIVGYVVVFIALAALVVVIGRIATVQQFIVRLRLRAKRGVEKGTQEPEMPAVSLSADENAAICTALYLYFTELHDEEKYVMTVKKVSRTYSPWSSKIYGIMNISKRG
jgi:Na+-transporting methylmalonyl-CoA/oxaloacetate decarboxylase gamma subunit